MIDDNKLIAFILTMAFFFAAGCLVGHLATWKEAKRIGYEQGYIQGMSHVE